MATTIGTLVVEMSANVARLQQDMHEAKDHVNKATEEIVRATEMAKGALEALGIGLGLMEFKEFIANSIEASARLNELSRRSGVSVESLNGLKYAASQTGADFEEMTKGVKKMSIYLAEAQINGGKQADMLKTLGITAKDPMKAMYQLADAMQRIPDAAQRTYIAQQMLGKGGEAMVPALLDGGEAFKKLVEEGNKLNPVTTKSAEQSNELADKLRKLAFAANGNATEFTKGLTPALLDFVNAISSANEKSQALSETGIAIGNAFKGFTIIIATAGYAAVETLSAINTGVNQTIALLQLHGSEAKRLGEEFTASTHARYESWKTFSDALLLGSQAHVEAANKSAGAAIDLSHSVGDLNKQFLTLEQRIQSQTDIFHANSLSQEKISETEKLRIEIISQLTHGTMQLTEAEKHQIDLMLVKMGMEEAAAKRHEEERKAQLEAHKVIEKANLATADSIAQIQFEQSLYGKSIDEIQRMTAAYQIDAKARKEIKDLHLNEQINKDALAMSEATAEILAKADAEKKGANAHIDYKNALAGGGSDAGSVEKNSYKQQLKELDAYYAAKQVEEGMYFKLREKLADSHEAKMIAIGKQGMLSRKHMAELDAGTQIQIASGLMQEMVGSASEHSQTMFSIMKVAKLSEAAVTLPSTVMKSYDAGAQWGPAVGAAFAAVALSAQLINMQAIASAEFGGGGGSAATGGGGASSTAILGQTANPGVVAAAPAISTAAQADRVVNIILPSGASPTDMYSADIVRNHIIPAINDAAGDGVIINVRSV